MQFLALIAVLAAGEVTAEYRRAHGHEKSLNLKVGDLVQVKTAAEILATLDAEQTVDGMPFMPEMLQYCGQSFRVYSSAHKTADTSALYTIRRMPNTVHLDELRCTGTHHGGCQAGCLLYWKEPWLKPATGQPATAGGAGGSVPPPADAAALARLEAATRQPPQPGQPECYRCQATEVLRASSEVRRRERFDPRFYIRDLTSGNVTPWDFLRFGLLAAVNAFLLRWFGVRYPNVRGRAGAKTPTADLNLQPGELVRVKPLRAVEETLSPQLRNRGMWFDYEMAMLCGKGPFRVLRRVSRIINERTGEMLVLKTPCIILDGVVCTGNYLAHRMFSRRSEYPFWREIWLERVAGRPAAPEAPRGDAADRRAS